MTPNKENTIFNATASEREFVLYEFLKKNLWSSFEERIFW